MAKLYDASGHYNKQHKKDLNNIFWRLLASELMAKAAARTYILTPGIKPGGYRTVLLDVVAEARQSSQGGKARQSFQGGKASQNIQHNGQLIKGDKQDTCKACQAGRRYASKRARPTRGSR
jgi:hypothetical protein